MIINHSYGRKWENLYRRFIPPDNRLLKKNLQIDLLTAAGQWQCCPDLIFTTKSAGILFDYSQRTIILVNHDHVSTASSFITAQCVPTKFTIYLPGQKYIFNDEEIIIEQISTAFNEFWNQ